MILNPENVPEYHPATPEKTYDKELWDMVKDNVIKRRIDAGKPLVDMLKMDAERSGCVFDIFEYEEAVCDTEEINKYIIAEFAVPGCVFSAFTVTLNDNIVTVVYKRPKSSREDAITKTYRARNIRSGDFSFNISVPPGKKFDAVYIGDGILTLSFLGDEPIQKPLEYVIQKR